MHGKIADLLEEMYAKYNVVGFIENDPISIPHQFTKKQDIEIAGFFAAILAWGQRKTIIHKCQELLGFMDNSPHDFILHHSEADLKRFLSFKHRTFNATDALYFIHWLKHHYEVNESLECAFIPTKTAEWSAFAGLSHFHTSFFSLEEAPHRTRKHIATPIRGSSCKRLNMFLRWMVRKDDKGVDFGLWESIQPTELICPCDVHVERVARKLQLITRPKPDWGMAQELTENLKLMDANDPVKFDFALFGMGVEGYL
ncbi:MAG: TIGR02757 family protein [Spirosomataceae bacterium]